MRPFERAMNLTGMKKSWMTTASITGTNKAVPIVPNAHVESGWSAPDSNARSVSLGDCGAPYTRRRSPCDVQISHSRNSVRSDMSGSSNRIFHIRRLTPDGRGGVSTCPIKHVINFVDYSLNQRAPAGHESAETPIGNESNGVIAGEGANFIVILFHCTCGFITSLINEGPHASTSYECTIMYSAPTEQLVIRLHIVPLLPTFHGMESENPYAHIKEFEDVCQGVSILGLIYKLNSSRSSFLLRTNGLKRQISNFLAKENEKFYECWERYVEAINFCPHHGFDTWLLVSYFYDGMSSSMKQLLKTMCGGDFMSKNPEEAMNFLSYIAEVSRGWDEPNRGEVGKMKSQPTALHAKAGMYTLNEDVDMKAKFAAMTRRVEELELKKMHEVQAVAETPVQVNLCSICQSYEHLVEECPTIPVAREMFGEQANVIGQFKPNSNASYGNTYNSSWRNNPKFFMEAKSTSVPTAGSTISTIPTSLKS
ncbi:hypothetical protein CK203_115844 [Vitis vinifera]|uniref:Retrotransposon gag domain-containing protein n=1 Tax=Vitis vinifera TaxID=29760 RepID=A0A438CSB6_VITVI|nr:hypothetical protein CK203_115844 [Vitis vinifera]